ncbi:MAG: hypothetical protein Q8N63_00740 [Nanoarchaeota archaeon]|nr:hypothetical protein [Nanoarchaeota archaeon]
MKELSKESVLWIFFVFISLIGISLVQASIDTRNSRGLTTTNFFTSDEVFLKSAAGLCNSIYKTVDIYVVESGDTILTDVRGQLQEINLTADYQVHDNTKIWAKPLAGNYDVIVDCDKSGSYHPLEPKASFSVSFKKGSGNASVGKEISNHSWQYDPEQLDLLNEMLQISVTAEGEDIDLTNITIKAIGSGDDTQLDALEIYIDGNNNGKLDEEEAVIGDSQPAYFQDNGNIVIGLDHTLTSGVAESILIVYKMKENVTEGDFSLSVTGLFGLGAQSKEEIKFSGFPINSNVKKVLAKKTCLGSLALVLEPNPVNKGENTIAKISNLTGCNNKTVFLRATPCSYLSGDIGSCVIKNDTCQLNVSSPENRIYYACVDKNDDKDKTDFGEAALSNLAVTAKEVEKANENITGEIEESVNTTNEVQEEEKTSAVTGEVISGLFDGSLKGVFVLLEITLLLILVVLIIISFKLKGNRQGKSNSEESEEETE